MSQAPARCGFTSISRQRVVASSGDLPGLPAQFRRCDGDGEGDIAGMRARLPYLADLGVDAIWVSPWYPSPMADGGYDVSDLLGHRPAVRQLADADAFIAEAHEPACGCWWTSCQPHVRPASVVSGGARRPARLAGTRACTSSATAAAPAATSHRTTGSAASAGAAGAGRRARRHPGSGTCTLFAAEQPDLDWTSPQVLAASTTSCGSGSTAASTGSGSTRRRPWARPTGCPTPIRRRPAVRSTLTGSTTRTGTSTRCTTCSAAGGRIGRQLRRRPDLRRRGGRQRRRAAEPLRPPRRDAHRLQLRLPESGVGRRARCARSSTTSLAALGPVGAPATWVLTSHDETRHVTRFGRATTRRPHFADGRRRGRRISSSALAGPGRPRCSCSRCPAAPTSTRARSWDCPRSRTCPTRCCRTRLGSAPAAPSRGRDGCRVPLPWCGDAPPFGFSPRRRAAVAAAAGAWPGSPWKRS